MKTHSYCSGEKSAALLAKASVGDSFILSHSVDLNEPANAGHTILTSVGPVRKPD